MVCITFDCFVEWNTFVYLQSNLYTSVHVLNSCLFSPSVSYPFSYTTLAPLSIHSIELDYISWQFISLFLPVVSVSFCILHTNAFLKECFIVYIAKALALCTFVYHYDFAHTTAYNSMDIFHFPIFSHLYQAVYKCTG